jgi:hypothetical protein
MSAHGPVSVEPDDPRVETLLDTDRVGSLAIRGDLANSRPGQVSLFLDDADDPAGLLTVYWSVRIIARDAGALERLLPALPEKNPRESDGSLMFGGVAEWIHDRILAAYEPVWVNRCWLWYLPDDVPVPDDLPRGIRSLRPKDAALVNEHWPHGDDVDYIRGRIKYGPTAAIFEKGRPISWVLTHGDDDAGLLTTLPEARRRGLARSVLWGLVREIRARGRIPFAYTLQENLAPQRMIEPMGFVNHGAYHWFGAKKR